MLRLHRPLILHLRDVKGDEYGSDVHSLCMVMMEELCSREQRVHVHCFTGREFIVKAWLNKYPNAYFGFTAKVAHFDQEQIAGLRAVPRDKILLETDAPYFPHGKASVSTPAYLGDTAAIIAGYLDMHHQRLLEVTVTNGRALYGQ